MLYRLFLAIFLLSPAVIMTGCNEDEPTEINPNNPDKPDGPTEPDTPDEPENPNTPSDNPDDCKELKVTINPDGTTSDGSHFSSIDETTFMLNYVKYRIHEGHIVVVGCDETEIKLSLNGKVTLYSTIVIHNISYKVRIIAIYSFYECNSLKEIIIPNSVSEIRHNAFEGCSALEKVTLSESINIIDEETFLNCTSLSSITIPNSVSEIQYNAFFGCKSLTEINLPNTINKIDWQAFKCCSSLKNINLSSNSKLELGTYVFQSCISLQSATLPESLTNIPNGTFADCISLKEINFPSSLNRIGISAFENCYALVCVDIPEGVTEITGAFTNCQNLISMSLPKTLKSFDQTTSSSNINHNYNYYLKYLYIKAINPPAINPKTSAFHPMGTLTILVPQQSLTKYTNSNWGHLINFEYPFVNRFKVQITGIDINTFDFKQYLNEKGVL